MKIFSSILNFIFFVIGFSIIFFATVFILTIFMQENVVFAIEFFKNLFQIP